jgi:hypothetical protein
VLLKDVYFINEVMVDLPDMDLLRLTPWILLLPDSSGMIFLGSFSSEKAFLATNY